MATYQELKLLSNDSTLIDRLTTAIAITAYDVGQEPAPGSPPDPTDPTYVSRRGWARETLYNPDGQARRVIWLLLAQYNNLTTVQIQGVTDANLQAAVDASLELFL